MVCAILSVGKSEQVAHEVAVQVSFSYSEWSDAIYL